MNQPPVPPNAALQTRILVALARAPAPTVSHLAGLVQSPRPSVSRAIHVLKNNGLVHYADQHWRITSEGRTALQHTKTAPAPPTQPEIDSALAAQLDALFLQFVAEEVANMRQHDLHPIQNLYEALGRLRIEVDDLQAEFGNKEQWDQPDGERLAALIVHLVRIAAIATKSTVDCHILTQEGLIVHESY